MPKTATKNPTEIKRQVLDLERKFWDALKTHDATVATKLTDDGCVVVGPQGIMEMPKKAVKGMIEDDSFELQDYQLNEKDAKVRAIGDDVAIVSYPVRERMKRGGETATLDAFDTSVWVRHNGSWVCALHTETIAEPSARM